MNIVAYTRNNKTHQARQFVGETKPFVIDLTKIEAELSDTIASCTWSVTSGGATIANEALSASKASANITATQTGKAVVKVLCEGASNAHIVYIVIRSNDPSYSSTDY